MRHAHALPNTNVVEQWSLLDSNGHVHNSNICIVEYIQHRRFTEVQLLKGHNFQGGLGTEIKTTFSY